MTFSDSSSWPLSSSSGNPVGVVSDLWRYPIKSFQGQRDRRAFLSPFGFLGDRRCVVVDTEDGLLHWLERMQAQRLLPR